MKNFYDLSQVNILITGSSGLLGSTYCKYFLKQGAHVIGIDKSIDYKKFNLLSSEKKNLSLFECDITNEQQIKDLFKKNSKKFNKLTVLINNAAYLKQISSKNESDFYKDFLKSSKSDWEDFIAVDITGSLLISKYCIPIMKKNHGGKIVNISSIYGILSPDQRLYESIGNNGKRKSKIQKPIGYSISKSAIINLTRYLSTLYAKNNIRVNTLTLGGVYAKNPKSFVKAYSSRTPLARMAYKEEYCGPLHFLISDASSYMTGSNLIVDGGWSSW